MLVVCVFPLEDEWVRFLHSTLVHSCLRHTAPCFCSFDFKSQSGNLLHHAVHHLPQTIHFFHEGQHLCAPLARTHEFIASCIRSRLPTSRAVVLYQTCTVAAYQVHATYSSTPVRCHRSSTRLETYFLHRFLSRRTHHMITVKGAMYIIWCGVNSLGDSGVKVE